MEIQQVAAMWESRAEFCRAVGMTPQFLSQIQTGKRPLPARYAWAIARATGGAVTVHDLRPDIFGPAPGIPPEPPKPAAEQEAP